MTERAALAGLSSSMGKRQRMGRLGGEVKQTAKLTNLELI